MQPPAAATALWAPELQEKAQPGVPLFSIFLREALRLATGQLGRMWFLPLFSCAHKPFELGREVTQPALLPGCCSGPPQDFGLGVQSCLPRCCQGQARAAGPLAHTSPHASAGTVFGSFRHECSVSPVWEKMNVLLLFHRRCLFYRVYIDIVKILVAFAVFLLHISAVWLGLRVRCRVYPLFVRLLVCPLPVNLPSVCCGLQMESKMVENFHQWAAAAL